MSQDINSDRSKGDYSEIELEAFQEISNIGVGHAATALSELLHRKIDMSVPMVNLFDIESLGEIMTGSPETVVTSILIDTELEEKMLNYLLIFNVESTRNILEILRTQPPPNNLVDLDDVGRSILKETGNILLHHVITAINEFTDSVWYPSIPQLAIDMVGSILAEAAGRENQAYTKFLQIKCDIFTEDRNLKGEIFIVPNKQGLKLLIEKLYGEGWEES